MNFDPWTNILSHFKFKEIITMTLINKPIYLICRDLKWTKTPTIILSLLPKLSTEMLINMPYIKGLIADYVEQEDIQYFSHLNYLKLISVKLDISSLTNLTSLNIADRLLNNLPLVNLRTLKLSAKTNVDISSLTNLTYLRASRYTTNDMIINMTNLVKLKCYDSISEVNHLSNLTSLRAVNNNDTITNISNLINLVDLTVPSQVINISNLTNITSLCCNHLIDDITSLTKLTDLELKHNLLPISNISKLTRLTTDFNITDDYVMKLTNLTILNSQSRRFLTDLGISNLINLTCLYSESINFTDRAYSQLTKLEYISCNQAIVKLPNLKSLNGREHLDDQTLQQLTGLKKLFLNRNNIVTEDGVRNLTNLRSLDITRNANFTKGGIKNLRLKTFYHNNNPNF